MDGCAGVNTQMVRRSGPTSRRRLPTAADEADMVIGVRGVLGDLNATPRHQEQVAWTVLDACGPRQPDEADRFSQPTVLEHPAAGKRALQLPVGGTSCSWSRLS